MGLVREMIRYGAEGVHQRLLLRRHHARHGGRDDHAEHPAPHDEDAEANHAKKKTRILAASPNYDTSAIEAGYLVFVRPTRAGHPRPAGLRAGGEVRQPLADQRERDRQRARSSASSAPELTAYADSGAAVGSTGLYSTSAANIDVYPIIVMGEEAAFDVALRGEDSVDPTHLPANLKQKSDPHGQRGYVGATFWSAVLVPNNGWMAVAEVGTTNTTPA
jgi:hypothetical protein